MLKNIFSKGCDWHYKCEECSSLYIVKYIPMYTFDVTTCIICAAKNNKSTPKLTQQQIDIKKRELKERLKK